MNELIKLVVALACVLAGGALCSEVAAKNDPIVMLDGKPVRLSTLSNPVGDYHAASNAKPDRPVAVGAVQVSDKPACPT